MSPAGDRWRPPGKDGMTRSDLSPNHLVADQTRHGAIAVDLPGIFDLMAPPSGQPTPDPGLHQRRYRLRLAATQRGLRAVGQEARPAQRQEVPRQDAGREKILDVEGP